MQVTHERDKWELTSSGISVKRARSYDQWMSVRYQGGVVTVLKLTHSFLYLRSALWLLGMVLCFSFPDHHRSVCFFNRSSLPLFHKKYTKIRGANERFALEIAASRSNSGVDNSVS